LDRREWARAWSGPLAKTLLQKLGFASSFTSKIKTCPMAVLLTERPSRPAARILLGGWAEEGGSGGPKRPGPKKRHRLDSGRDPELRDRLGRSWMINGGLHWRGNISLGAVLSLADKNTYGKEEPGPGWVGVGESLRSRGGLIGDCGGGQWWKGVIRTPVGMRQM